MLSSILIADYKSHLVFLFAPGASQVRLTLNVRAALLLSMTTRPVGVAPWL
jgi:hypothetical protein